MRRTHYQPGFRWCLKSTRDLTHEFLGVPRRASPTDTPMAEARSRRKVAARHNVCADRAVASPSTSQSCLIMRRSRD